MLHAVFLDLSFCVKQVLCCSLRRNQRINLFEVKDRKKSMISKNFENYRICNLQHKSNIIGSSLCFSRQIEWCRNLGTHRWAARFLIQIWSLRFEILKEKERGDSGNWKVTFSNFGDLLVRNTYLLRTRCTEIENYSLKCSALIYQYL